MGKRKNITKRMCKKCEKYHITLLNGDEVQLTEEAYNNHLKGNEQKLQSKDDLDDHITQKNREFRETLSYSKSITEETLLEGREENIPIVLNILFNWFKDNFNRRQSKSHDKKELLKREIETLEKLFDPNQDLSNPTYLEVVRAIPIYSFQKYLIEEDYERVQKFKSEYGKINLQNEEGAKTYNTDYDKTVNKNGTEITLLESLLKSWEEIFDRKEISFPAAKDIRKYYNDIIVQGQDSYYEQRNYFKNEKLDFYKLEADAMHKYLKWLSEFEDKPKGTKESQNNTKKNIPAKYYALYHRILIEMGKENAFEWNKDDNFPKSKIIAFAKKRYPKTSAQNFYNEFKKIYKTKKEDIASNFGSGYKEKVKRISENDSDVLIHLKSYPK